MANLQRIEMNILNAKFLTGNASFSTLFKEAENFLPGLHHRTDPIYHMWKSSLGDL